MRVPAVLDGYALSNVSALSSEEQLEDLLSEPYPECV